MEIASIRASPESAVSSRVGALLESRTELITLSLTSSLQDEKSAGELESVDEEAIGEAHLEVVDKGDGEGDSLPGAREARDKFREQDAHGRGNDIVDTQGAERQGDGLGHIETPEDGNSIEQGAPDRTAEVRARNARQASHHVHQPLARFPRCIGTKRCPAPYYLQSCRAPAQHELALLVIRKLRERAQERRGAHERHRHHLATFVGSPPNPVL